MTSASSPTPLPPPLPPQRLHLDRQNHLDITWNDGQRSIFPLTLLRSQCPCASCKQFREDQASRKSLLNILPGNYTDKVIAERADLVGNYAMQIHWSDGHASGIYSFQYLYEIRPKQD